MKRIVYVRPDGGIGVVNPSPEFMAQFPTEDAALSAIQAKDVPTDAMAVQIVDEADIPTSRVFRNAWRQLGGVFSVDMPTACKLQAGKIAAAIDAESKRLMSEERQARIAGRTAAANKAAAGRAAIDALDLSAIAIQIASAPDPTALSAIWPMEISR